MKINLQNPLSLTALNVTNDQLETWRHYGSIVRKLQARGIQKLGAAVAM